VTIDGVQRLLPAILSALHIETLVHGNASEASARKLVQTIERCLGKRNDGTGPLQPLYSNQIWRAREVQLDEGRRFVPECLTHKLTDHSYLYAFVQSTHANSCVNLFFQIGVENVVDTVALELLVQAMQVRCSPMRMRTVVW
jgi:secreted Zn-dependent insulinase-like peptidase